MRIIVLFDLPMETSAEKRNYNRFRKGLIKDGFIMMQKSVYCKLAMNSSAAEVIIKGVHKIRPSSGVVQILSITENQFQKIQYIVGNKESNIIDSTERMLVI